MNKIIILIIALLLIFGLSRAVGAHHRPDHNPPGHQVELPEQVCNENPSQNHNPHCRVEDEPVDEVADEVEKPEEVIEEVTEEVTEPKERQPITEAYVVDDTPILGK